MRLTQILHNERLIELVLPTEQSNDSNTYTLLVGTNGVGKSRLLQTICHTLLNEPSSFNMFSNKPTNLALNIKYQLGEETYSISNTNRVRLQAHIRIVTNDGKTVTKLVTINASSPNDYFIEEDYEGLIINEYEFKSLLKSYFMQDLMSYKCTTAPTSEFKYISTLIAVTSSPFDKFPTYDSHRSEDHSHTKYYYRGSRLRKSGSSSDRELDYIDQKFNQLGSSFLNLFLGESTRLQSVKKVFEFLGYNFQFELNLSFGQQFGFAGGQTHDLLSSTESIRFFKGRSRKNLSDEEKELINKELQDSFERVRDYYKINIGPFFDNSSNLDLTMNLNDSSQDDLLDDLILLANYDIIDLVNISFTKTATDTSFLLTDASSGELCILFNILSIAGVIENDSLILIDEPELSLHPKWQEDFLPLLCDIFSNYSGCHFILSTHSPNIVSTLPEHNSYLVNLESREIRTVIGSAIKNKSLDYQMTHTFNVNNPNNEYLIRITLEVFFHLSKKKTLPEGDLLLDFKYLLGIRNKINDSKLLDLIDSCIELSELYG
ncbi:putative ATPase AAA-type core domain-containing protein [Vibrio crassostreae]|uniref:AAA family ATPase n=1 Tax=Vibrio TaxID=662 RepID=UPI000310E29D|nr:MULTISPECIES: AAA family ATPase [Vibrio]OEE16451.1 hypothetical protein OC1_10370 [Vibrio cyclitrophicus ZF207]TDW01372.1 AAA ATPase-like protein [Vibrio crassostreae]CAK2100164.1 putative ATPase AAA-type core domain-containing protein [Vibrio crassostreae]CAK2113094.1 putative ATPase AAA-type core domain-containing protein [Vibrio crassostreae]CAK2154469.1 putative ATPase AAA-type core domain-containing protein [Vibrio crassostreae]